MHTRAAVAVFDAEASNKIVTGKVTSDRSMNRPFPAYASTDLIGTMGALTLDRLAADPGSLRR
jgi:hypothetical protein